MMSPQERMVLFQRCLSSIDDNEYEVYFSQWFRVTFFFSPFSHVPVV